MIQCALWGGGTPFVPRGLSTEIAIFGDSRTRQCHSNIIPTVANNLPIPANVTSSYLASLGYAGWIQTECRARVTFPADLNFGISGDDTSEMLMRVATVAASQADVVVVLGGTNDTDNGVSAATMIANMTAILQALVVARKLVILIAELPRGDLNYAVDPLSPGETGFPLSAQELVEFDAYRAWMLNDAPKLAAGQIIIANPYELWAIAGSVSGYVQPGLTYDGLHPSPAGARLIAQVIIPIIDALFPARENLLPSPAPSPLVDAAWPSFQWLNENPLLAGSGGAQGAGIQPGGPNPNSPDVPDFWATTRNGPATRGVVNMNVSTEEDSDGLGRWFRIFAWGETLPFSEDEENPEVEIRSDYILASSAGLTAGDRVIAIGEVEVMPGSYGLAGVTISLRQEIGTSPTSITASRDVRALNQRGAAEPIPPFAVANRAVQLTNAMTLQPNVIQIRVRCILQLAEGKRSDVESHGVRATVRFRRVGIRKISP